MCCVADTQAVPPVQVFDKTMVVKQMHVLEPQDLLITRADKGSCAVSFLFFCFNQNRIFAEHIALVRPPLVFHLAHLSYVVEYILNLSTSVVPANALICHCNLRKLTYREPISMAHVGVFVCTVGFYRQTQRIEMKQRKHHSETRLSVRTQLLLHLSLVGFSQTCM